MILLIKSAISLIKEVRKSKLEPDVEDALSAVTILLTKMMQRIEQNRIDSSQTELPLNSLTESSKPKAPKSSNHALSHKKAS